MKTLLYYLVKLYIKTGLYFYSKKIRVIGSENVPKKGAVLFLANHPNGLVDPLFIATNTSRKTFFLVRAAVFKNKIVAFLFDLIGMMPIYRIRDGIKELSKNDAIFNKCYDILGSKKSLLIFPEGSHNRKRTVRPLSKGFTRIVFGTIDKYPNLPIHLVPVGITYQNSSTYPCKIALHYGNAIIANDYYNKENINQSANQLKSNVQDALERLCVHIPTSEYEHTNNLLNTANIDFTNVEYTNQIIQDKVLPVNTPKKKKNIVLLSLVIINSFIPYFLWKTASKKVDEIEFVDTFRFAMTIVLFPLFYALQAFIIYRVMNNISYAVLYFLFSILLVLLYTKTSTTNSE
ncbi:PlsC domain-containing protein [Tenacibaculum sp. 190130A14a]|uniref:PlsC domain-containing protein n=1 Tax=Tenacibaculum polynesiense TaxID=3137857 RepID=A0ABP1F462_9FLAO